MWLRGKADKPVLSQLESVIYWLKACPRQQCRATNGNGNNLLPFSATLLPGKVAWCGQAFRTVVD